MPINEFKYWLSQLTQAWVIDGMQDSHIYFILLLRNDAGDKLFARNSDPMIFYYIEWKATGCFQLDKSQSSW